MKGAAKMNNGHRAEKWFREFLQEIAEDSGKLELPVSDGTKISYTFDSIKHGGSSQHYKADATLHKCGSVVANGRLSVKTTKGHRASFLNVATIRNLQKMEERTNLAVSHCFSLFAKLAITGKAVKLAEVANKEDWRQLLEYFVFDGTPTRDCEQNMAETANLLVDIPINDYSALLAVRREDAVDYIWNHILADLKLTKNGKEVGLTLRYEKA